MVSRDAVREADAVTPKLEKVTKEEIARECGGSAHAPLM
jgi:hypothetical protein